MKNLKKTLVMVVSLALVAALAIGGTVAYLTVDPENKSNIFTVGDISIVLDEEVAVHGAGNVDKTKDGATYTGVMPGDYLKKEVSVANTGNNPAYVAVEVTINNALEINNAIDAVYEKKYGKDTPEVQAMYDYIFDGFGLNYTKKDANGNDTGMRLTITGDDTPEGVMQVDSVKTIHEYWQQYSGNWFMDEKTSIAAKGNPYNGYYTTGMDDYEIRYTYYMLLEKDQTVTLFKGLNVPASFNAEQLKMFDGLTINVEASAIQADNMAIAEEYKNDANGKAKTAFAILAGDIETPEYSNKPSGTVTYGYTTTDRIWGEATGNAKETFVIKVYSGDTYMGETSLKNIDGIIDGDVYVTWNFKLNAASNTDSYWNMSWTKVPSANLMPTTVELWIDGEKVNENKVKLNGPDNLNKIGAAVVDANGTILRYVVNGTEANLQEGEFLLSFVSGNTELDSAIKSGATSIVLSDGTYNMPASAKGKTLTITGSDNTIIEVVPAGQGEAGGQLDYNLDGSTVTFNNVTIKTNNKTYAGYARLNANYNNCVFENQYCLNGNSEFNSCTFNVSGDVYNIWTWGAPNATFNNCTFNSDGKALLLYGTVNTSLTVNNCVFNDNGSLTDLKAAIEIGNDYNKSYTLIVNNTVVNGYEINDKGINTNSTLWANKNSMSKEKLNVVIDGVDVY